MKTSLNQTATVWMYPSVHLFVPTHVAEWATAVTPISRVSSRQHGYATGRRNSSGPPVLKITWERDEGSKPEHCSLSVPSFLSVLLRCGCAFHRTANKIRLWGGPHPSGSLCVFGTDLVIENSCKRSCWNQHCVWERVGKRETTKIIAYPIFPQF